VSTPESMPVIPERAWARFSPVEHRFVTDVRRTEDRRHLTRSRCPVRTSRALGRIQIHIRRKEKANMNAVAVAAAMAARANAPAL
jgi:hypothetical protein